MHVEMRARAEVTSELTKGMLMRSRLCAWFTGIEICPASSKQNKYGSEARFVVPHL